MISGAICCESEVSESNLTLIVVVIDLPRPTVCPVPASSFLCSMLAGARVPGVQRKCCNY